MPTQPLMRIAPSMVHRYNVETEEIIGRLVRLGEAALTWDELRRKANDLKAARNAIECEGVTDAFAQEFGEVVARGTTGDPCWRIYVGFTGDGERQVKAPVAEWCPSCQKRQAIQDELAAVNRQRGAAMRRMQRLAGKGI